MPALPSPPPTIRQVYPPLGYTQLTLQETGLQVEEKRFFNRTEILISYEDLMPIGVARQHSFPFRLTLAALFLTFGCAKAAYMVVTLAGQRESALWLLLILGGLLLAIVAFALRQWRHDFVLTTARGNIALFDSRRNRSALYDFANLVRDHTILYLREQYAEVDPTQPAESQLARLDWLQQVGVLNKTQVEQRKTRLLGKFYGSQSVPGNEFGLAPSVN
ncbi:hypothetical protein [Hymenobacter cellulosilyticus]|uniref:Uncharacterized protein n=1 Tax=Hymenobacter cellulosilyticus TaxID=2932248 RepID=A0A8T9QBK6_9BACT|nr:hypothetical protein [Hymenobacter cellulosilyticus]UOQ74887.1 hypothetical protein MUN79_14075 [Hymenobacter cellulosilyticus]